jgi:glutathione reductase (NADPH)
MERFDLIVLGAGSGGLSCAIRAARRGARVALFDPNPLGGTCVNVGCVPKKAMWIAADLAESVHIAQAVGFAVEPAALDWNEFIRRRSGYIDAIHASYRLRLEEFRIEYVTHYGRFVGADRIAADGREFTAKHIVIATGAKPRRAKVTGGDLGIVSDGFFDLRASPRRVAIVGGGYIAVELAGVLRALGSDVSLFVRGERLLTGFDEELSTELSASMVGRGIDVRYRAEPASVTRDGALYALHARGGTVADGYDELIWALGRDANVDTLDLDAAGVRMNATGHIATDEWQDTNVEGVHAIGDVTGRVQLTPVAVAAGRRLADRLFGGKADSKLDYANIPSVVFSHPPLGAVGLTETEARDRFGDDVVVYRVAFRPMLCALTTGNERTFMKLVCVGADERVVGIHLFGRSADEMLQGFAVALKAGAKKCDFDATVAIHPTSAEELVLMGEMNRTPVI